MLKKCLRTLCMLLVITLLINMLPMSVFAQEFQEHLSATEQAEFVKPEESAEEAYIVKEITENRTEFSKEFQLSNGLRMAAVYADAVHYETDNGWEEIDNTLTAHTDGTYATTAGVWQVRFPDQLTKAKGITLQKDGYTLSFYMAGELKSNHELMTIPQTQEMLTAEAEAMLPQTFAVEEISMSAASIQPVDTEEMKASVQYPQIVPEKASSRLLYENIYENTDLIYDLNGNQVKESIVLSKYDSALRGYQYALETGTMHPVLNEDGSIYFYDADQENIVMVMPAPYLVDDAQDYCDDIAVSLTGQDGIYTLSYQLPLQWLAAQDRAWPVVLDPVVQANLSAVNIRDRTIAQKKTYAQDWGMNTCGYASDTGIMRFYLKYNALPELTSSDVVVGAAVHMYKAFASSTVTPVYVHKVNGQWDSSTITWANAPAMEQTVEDYAIVDPVQWYGWDITDIARDWYADQNTGMAFTASSEIENGSTENFKQFLSADFGTESSRPILTIYFRNNNGLESYWDYTASSAGRAGTGYVNNFTGNLVFVREDMGFGGNRMPVSISHIYNLNDSSNNEFGLGKGWRTNFNQKVYQWSVDNSYYIWEDADGTRHYFEYSSANTYKDEDGLEMTLTTNGSGTEKYCIQDKNKNCSFFDTQGRLSKQTNNQATESSITITYKNATSKLITKITDGVGRAYNFSYVNDFLSEIQYVGTGANTDANLPHRMVFSYASSCLTKVRHMDGKDSDYTYTNGLLTTATDLDGYKLTYTYHPVADALWQPYRVQSVSESDGAAQGGSLSISYAHNQTTFTDHNGNVEIHQFNDFGNTLCIQDDEGHAQYAQFARNTDSDSGKTNQLTLSSKLQNTVGNLLNDASFETGNNWIANLYPANASILSATRTTETAYLGSYSLKVTVGASGSSYSVYSPRFSVQPGETITYSAYVKNPDSAARIALHYSSAGNYYTYSGETLQPSDTWVRTQVHFTNNTSATISMYAYLFTQTPGTYYIDCAQVERAATASRYNLVENGDFSHTSGWLRGRNLASVDTYVTETAATATLDSMVYRSVGDPTLGKHLYQQVKVSGEKGDTFVLAGWAKGDSVPLTSGSGRRFALVAYFMNNDGSTTERIISFNPDCPNVWQYVASAVIADKEFYAINIDLQYDYNLNTVYFDGIQLYKEEFGASYTYDENGNVKTVTDLQKQTTTYEYANNDLTKIIENGNPKMSYDYDDYHNVETATTDENLVYNFTYDTYGNNTSVSISKDGSTMSSSATYSTDGNRLESTTDALGNETLYSYNKDTNVLDWVQYPNDTATTHTEYDYDSMYRMASAACQTNKGNSLSAEYTYGNNTQADLLTAIQTPSTTYNFTYGDFGLRTRVKAGTTTLAEYIYTEDANRYLSMLDYGNEGSVEYTYDNKGRLLTEVYEDGDTVTYTYDNNGALATMVDHATGITTTYYYDLSDRMAKYTESGASYSHSVEYTYDVKNNLQKQEETINGVDHTTEYEYDDDNRIEKVTANGTTITYTYDDFGRVTQKVTTNDEGTLRTESYTYVAPQSGKTSAQVATHTIVTGNTTQTFTYTYDGNGNITSIFDGVNTTSYAYDSANQLIRENNQYDQYTHTWTYDDAGNILSRNEYDYTTGSLENVTPEYIADNTYSTSGWGDLPTSYDSDSVECDAIGNIAHDLTWQYTWEHGRQLASMADVDTGDPQWEFTYNTDGMRTQRTNGTTTYNYVYNGSSLSQMTVGNDTLTFAYDAEGRPMTVTYNGTTYYYATNLQGDVTGIFKANGDFVVIYLYDAWGRVWSVTGSMANTLGTLNPLRYRGYVYDQETGLYYVSSRYYDPKIGRWINADIPETITADFENFAQYNLFAYCFNNPVNMLDYIGCWPIPILSADGNEELVYTVQSFFVDYIISFASSHDLNRRPNRGEPGSVFTAPNGDKRGFGANGLPEWDYDHSDHNEKDKPRDENGGHWHDWDWSKEKPRGDAHLMSEIGIVGGILLALEFLLTCFAC